MQIFSLLSPVNIPFNATYLSPIIFKIKAISTNNGPETYCSDTPTKYEWSQKSGHAVCGDHIQNNEHFKN